MQHSNKNITNSNKNFYLLLLVSIPGNGKRNKTSVTIIVKLGTKKELTTQKGHIVSSTYE